MPRENSKSRKWEKERRDRLKEGFTNLAKALPCYDPSINICKIDILHKAASSIQELQDRIKHLLSSDTENKTEKEVIIKKLQERIKKLLVRNEQLTNLLRDAGITVPSVCGTIKKFKKQPLWSHRISPEQAELRKIEMEKENIVSVQLRKKKKLKAVVSEKDKSVTSTEQKARIRKNRKKRAVAATNCYIVLSQTMPFRNYSTQQYYLITNQSNSNIARNIIKSEGLISGTTSKPLVVKTKHKSNRSVVDPSSSLSSLGPGTLILGNGVTLPVLPQQQSLIPNSPNLILNSTLYSIPKLVQSQSISSGDKNIPSTNSLQTTMSTGTKTLPFIKPKYCLTRTTQVNKVPIPALTSRYANSYCLFRESKPESTNKRDVAKTKKAEQAPSMKNGTKKAVKRKIDDQEDVNNKRNKNDVENEVSNSKTAKNNTVTVTSSDHDPGNLPVVQENSTNLSTANIPKSSESVERKVESVITNEPKNVEVEKISEIVQPKVTETKNMDSLDISEKKQEVPISKECENPQISIIPAISSSTVTTTSVSTIAHDDMKSLEINLPHSELSNDLFASLQVPSGCQNPESTSPTAAFLLAFPLVSSGVKVTEVIDGENSESQSVTPTLLQIGTMDTTKSTQSQPDVITSNFLNLDSFSFFSSKDICGGFDSNYSTAVNNCKSQAVTTVNVSSKAATSSNTSIYVNVKSPSVPTCVATPVKQNCNTFCKTARDPPKDIGKDMKNCEKPSESQKFVENNIYNSQILPHTKASTADLNFRLPKVGDSVQKNLEQKSQCHISTTYPNSTYDFNYRCDFTKTCIASCSYTNVSKNYTNPLYTNCNNYNYNYHPDTNFNQNYYKNIPRNETKAYYPLNYDYPDYRKNDSTGSTVKCDTSVYMKDKKNNNIPKVKTTTESKQPINWMTTPDNRLQTSECLLTPFSKSNFSQTYPFTSYVTSSSTYFSTNTMDTNKMNCVMPLNSHQRLDMEEKQFSWSPTKLPHFLDPPHTFVTSTLPTLVGDLALGNTLPFSEQKNDYKPIKESKDFRQLNKVNSYENQSNFLSVSQLVDHNKSESIAAKPTSRRNSGNRAKNNIQQKAKRVTKHDNKDIMSHCGINDNMHQSRSANNYNTFSSIDLFTDHKNKNPHKNSSSSYSAEALIGNQVPDETVNKRYPVASNKSLGTSSFLAENIISYFPPVDIPQENYISQNQNYQSNNYTTSFQNNTSYPSNSFMYTASTISSSYLGTNNFDTGPQDYLTDSINLISNTPSKDKQYNTKNCSKQLNKEDKMNLHSVCSNNLKRPKKKSSNDANNALFDFPFLPIPASNNSPILPDDFPTHSNFLAPTAPFSCKNSLFPKQNNDITGASLLPLPPVCRSTIQHPEISPINAVGPSLTNFNLSTIFPEINKGPISDMYQDPRIKDQLHHKSYSSTMPQVPFNAEPKFNFST